MSDTGYAMVPPIDPEDKEFEDDSLYEETRVTWGEFKKQVEECRITDDMEVSYIDWGGVDSIQVRINEDKSFTVT